jgi:hypothetical protein
MPRLYTRRGGGRKCRAGFVEVLAWLEIRFAYRLDSHHGAAGFAGSALTPVVEHFQRYAHLADLHLL